MKLLRTGGYKSTDICLLFDMGKTKQPRDFMS